VNQEDLIPLTVIIQPFLNKGLEVFIIPKGDVCGMFLDECFEKVFRSFIALWGFWQSREPLDIFIDDFNDVD